MKFIKLFIKIFILLFASAAALSSFFTNYKFSPFVGSKKKDLQRIKKLLAVKKGEVVFELGCGDGSTCRYLAMNTKAQEIVGIELSLIYYCIAKVRIFFNENKNRCKIVWGNFFKKDLSKADKVFLFLTTKTANRLSKKMLQELKKGCRVIAYNFPISGWEYIKKDQPKKSDVPIYIYEVDSNIQSLVYNV